MKSDRLKFSLKSIFYVLLVNIASVLNGLAYIYDKIDQTEGLMIQIGIFAILAPAYFFIKGKVYRPWLYVAITFLLHIIVAFITYFAMHSVFSGEQDLVFFYINLFSLIFYIGVAGLDIIVMCCNEFKKH